MGMIVQFARSMLSKVIYCRMAGHRQFFLVEATDNEDRFNKPTQPDHCGRSFRHCLQLRFLERGAQDTSVPESNDLE